jgi:hypothetical protein
MRIDMCMRVVAVGAFIGASCFAANDRPYLNAAVEAGHWIEKSAIQKDTGTVWPSDPADLKTVNTGLYSGTPGPILFYLEAYHDSGDKKFLDRPGPAPTIFSRSSRVKSRRVYTRGCQGSAIRC